MKSVDVEVRVAVNDRETDTTMYFAKSFKECYTNGRKLIIPKIVLDVSEHSSGERGN